MGTYDGVYVYGCFRMLLRCLRSLLFVSVCVRVSVLPASRAEANKAAHSFLKARLGDVSAVSLNKESDGDFLVFC